MEKYYTTTIIILLLYRWWFFEEPFKLKKKRSIIVVNIQASSLSSSPPLVLISPRPLSLLLLWLWLFQQLFHLVLQGLQLPHYISSSNSGLVLESHVVKLQYSLFLFAYFCHRYTIYWQSLTSPQILLSRLEVPDLIGTMEFLTLHHLIG